jgi:alkaline phosphatase
MSGLGEAGIVIGLISGIVAIVNTTKKIYDAANDAEGLPGAFREVAAKLPVVIDILDNAKACMHRPEMDANTCKAMKEIFESCTVKAKQLEDIFQKVVPKDGEQRLVRYWKAARTVGKGGRVEHLMEAILKSLDLLGNSLQFAAAIKTKLEMAIAEVSAIPPSLPDNFEDMSGGINNLGSGPQNVNSGSGSQTNNTNSGSGSQIIGGPGGSQTIHSR